MALPNHNQQTGTGYSYSAALIGLVMLLISSLDFKLEIVDGKQKFSLEQKEIPTAILAFAGGLITVGLGVRVTAPGLIGMLLPNSQAVEQLGQKLTGEKPARELTEPDQPESKV